VVYTAVDCQGFAGGFTLGVVQAGFQLVGKREMRGGFGVANCEANRHLLGADWSAEAVEPDAWSVPAGGADLVFGNPPCSGFSVLSSKQFRGVDSKINACMWAFVEYAARVRPRVAIFESVQLAYSQGRELMRDLRARLEELTGDGWTLHHVLHNALSVGGPALRRRYFWVASRVPFGVERPRLVEVPNLEEVVGDLRDLAQLWQPQRYVRKPTWYSVRLRSTSRVVDGHVSLDNPHTRRTLELLELTDWKPNEHTQQVTRRYFDEHGELPPSWRHLTDRLKNRDFFQGFNTPIMWHPGHRARVVTGGALQHAIHWAERRMFTHREAARILGFPDDWRIEPLRGVSGLFMTWGKGITVDCGRWIAACAARALDGTPDAYVGEPIGDDEWLIDITNDWKNAAIEYDTVEHGEARKTRRTNVTEAPIVATVAAPRRGRPRPPETQDRDEKVFAAITEPVTRGALALATGFDPKLVYLSLYRLRRDGLVQRRRENGAHVWAQTAPSAG
jgi:site-specific DNA-cytosine methylase